MVKKISHYSKLLILDNISKYKLELFPNVDQSILKHKVSALRRAYNESWIDKTFDSKVFCRLNRVLGNLSNDIVTVDNNLRYIKNVDLDQTTIYFCDFKYRIGKLRHVLECKFNKGVS